MEIRVASVDDIETVVDIIAQARAWQDEVGEPAAFGTDRRKETELGVRHGEVYLGYLDETAMSTCSITETDPNIWPDDDGSALYIHRLVVLLNFTSKVMP